MDNKQALDRATGVIIFLSAVVPIGGAYLFYLGSESTDPDSTSTDSAHLPADEVEDADPSSDPDEDE